MNKESLKKPNLIKELRQVNVLYMFAITIIANVLVGGMIGYFLDKHTFKNRVLFVVFLALGIASGFYQGIRELMKEAKKIEPIDRKEEDDRKENKESL